MNSLYKLNMSKRRRTSSIASRGQEDDYVEDTAETSGNSGQPGRKRSKKLDPTELCQQLYDTIRNFKKDDGALLCDSFIRAPKRRQEPGYYEVVTNPIDLLKVQQKLKTDEYEDMEELSADIELMINNAKAFYKKNSHEYRDACDLWELFISTKNKLLETEIKNEENEKGKLILKVGKLARRAAVAESRKQDVDIAEDTSETSTNPDDDFNQYEDLFTAVMMATDVDNRPLHTVFQLLPSKKKYPDYYEVIESPIDLKIIATKIQNNEYTSLSEMEKDLLLMTKNACLFNEPGSQIYKDAKALKKIISSKKIEIEHGKTISGKSSERIRSKRLRGVQSLSAVTAALKDEETDTEAEEPMDEETEVIDFDNPQWQLFETVRSAQGAQGVPLSEPFWKLPSKRYYPDYYKEIKNPVSLTQIRRKLKKGDYGTVSEVAGDMNIMFENAKKYNVPSSKLYKDAVKMQKIMQTKVQELLEIDQDTDSEAESEDSRGVRKRTSNKGRPPSTPGSAPRGRPKDTLKRRLHSISKCLIDFACEDGRLPLLLFMEKPSKKLYPDYYQVIAEPLDVLTIESNIRNDKYSCEDELVADFKLMFANCRQYNEEGSQIYDDAILLERILMEKVKEMAIAAEKKALARIIKPRKNLNPVEQKLRSLYDAIRDYREPKSGRQLALIFMKLPSKNDYPDYYEVIKQPIDMERISAKLRSSVYESLDEIVGDFVLMFDNACKYNEPDSQIYKDALILQRVCLQTKQQLREGEAEDTVPDVQLAVQDLLATLFTSVYNHQDEEGRCFSDSMSELPEHDDFGGKKIRALSLDLIKRRLDRGLYRRLDVFQDDFFTCLERARRLSRTDSQIFEDSIELQSFFIKQRDEICRNGDLLSSPALNYSLTHLTAAVEATKQNKMVQETPEDENESRISDDTTLKENTGDTMTCNQRTFRVGEFVYTEAKEKGVEPSVLYIERLWTNKENQQMLYGNYFLRPSETYHLATRRFMEKEVFKSDTHVALPLNEVKERCCVLNVKDYIKYRPEGYAEKDVYVCESRYSTKARSFKKIKIWPVPDGVVRLVERPIPLVPRRVMSVFRERVEKHKDELAELAEQEHLVEKEKPNVVVFNPGNESGTDEGNIYYEQYNTIISGVVKTGDFVYVASDSGRQLIAQIDTIWETKDGKCYFRGPWLVTPPEIPHAPTRLFYKQEVFLSTIEDTNPLVGIVGKCAVLEYGEYVSSRPTEIPESDIFVCESQYDEVKRLVCKLPSEGLKKYQHSNVVTEDEIYYFPRVINPPKVTSDIVQVQPEVKVETTRIMDIEASPLLTKVADVEMLMEDSLDGGPPSVGSGEIPVPISVVAPVGIVNTPVSSKKKSTGKKLVTGYILYSSEVRKSVAQNHPESTFGEISRIVGNEWRSLPAGEKQSWEEKAARCNEENAARMAVEESCPSPAPVQPAPVVLHSDHVFECCWDDCDFQFEELNDCIDHCIQEGAGHVQMYFATLKDPEFQCHWRGCVRIKKGAPPFPHLPRLARHVREVHINKGNGKVIPPNDRNKNFVPSARKLQAAAAARASPHGPSTITSITKPPAEPVFVTVPPRPTRVLHSEAYIKYIEGLQSNNKYMSNWERTLHATQDNTPTPNPEKLPSSWLANGVGNHDSVTSALWALRNYMVRDLLNLNTVLK